MCEHRHVEHITPKGMRPLFADNMTMEFWECSDCGALFSEDPHEEDYEVIDERKEVLKTLFN